MQPRADGQQEPRTPLQAARRRDGASGQVLVIFSLSIVGLLVAAGLAFDIGRFYSEKRFLQNAADAAALAAANALIRGETSSQADSEARDVLTRNFAGDPNGTPPSLPPATPVYESGHAGDPSYLANGILISGGTVRVAVQNPVNYTLARVAGFSSQTIGGKAMVKTMGDLLPTALRRYVNAPGPNASATSPCPNDQTEFLDFLATADTACLGSSSDGSLRTDPDPGLNFDASNPDNDTAHHGPIVTLVGQGAVSSNAADFRGFIALDIRDFASDSPPSNVFYNGVTAGTQSNVLKGMESGWVATGYPGPAFPPATSPPDPNDQVGIMDGNSAGLIVSAVQGRYTPGDEILTAVYSGTVMSIPDFVYAVPSQVSIGTNQNRNNSVTMTVSKNSSFNGVVTSFAWPDNGDSQNPLLTGKLLPITFSPSPATPDTTITWTTFQTSSAPGGIYTIWIQGHSSSPYLTDHYYPVAVNVGNVNRDFATSSSGLVLSTPNTNSTVSGTLNFTTPNKGGTSFRGDVTVSLEGAPPNDALPSGLGSWSMSPSTFTLDGNKQLSGDAQAVTLTIDTGSLGPGLHTLTVRATGVASTGDKVTHKFPITLAIGTGTTSNNYIDITGFAVFRITAINSNSVDGYAISPLIADMNDPRLRRGQVARLVPWT